MQSLAHRVKPATGPVAGRMRRAGAVVGLVAVAAVLTTGCGIVDGITAERNTTGPLHTMGFGVATITFSPTRPSSASVPMALTVNAQPIPQGAIGQPPPISTQYQDIEQSVWQDFPYSFSTLTVTIAGNQPVTFTYSQLLADFGPRPGNVGSKSLGSVVYTGWSYVYDAGYALIGVVVLLIVRLLWRRTHEAKAKVPVTEGKYGGWMHQVSHMPVHLPHLHHGATPAGTAPPGPAPSPLPPTGQAAVPTPSSWTAAGDPAMAGSFGDTGRPMPAGASRGRVLPTRSAPRPSPRPYPPPTVTAPKWPSSSPSPAAATPGMPAYPPAPPPGMPAYPPAPPPPAPPPAAPPPAPAMPMSPPAPPPAPAMPMSPPAPPPAPAAPMSPPAPPPAPAPGMPVPPLADTLPPPAPRMPTLPSQPTRSESPG